jgi:hypothetical protein
LFICGVDIWLEYGILRPLFLALTVLNLPSASMVTFGLGECSPGLLAVVCMVDIFGLAEGGKMAYIN